MCECRNIACTCLHSLQEIAQVGSQKQVSSVACYTECNRQQSSGEAPKPQAAWEGTGLFGSEVFFTLEFT